MLNPVKSPVNRSPLVFQAFHGFQGTVQVRLAVFNGRGLESYKALFVNSKCSMFYIDSICLCFFTINVNYFLNIFDRFNLDLSESHLKYLFWLTINVDNLCFFGQNQCGLHLHIFGEHSVSAISIEPIQCPFWKCWSQLGIIQSHLPLHTGTSLGHSWDDPKAPCVGYQHTISSVVWRSRTLWMVNLQVDERYCIRYIEGQWGSVRCRVNHYEPLLTTINHHWPLFMTPVLSFPKFIKNYPEWTGVLWNPNSTNMMFLSIFCMVNPHVHPFSLVKTLTLAA